MRRVCLLSLSIALIQQLSWASYSYYSTYSSGSTQFYKNGTLTNLTTPYGAGVTSSSSNGGSLISNQPVPDGSTNYEAVMTLGIADSGVTYTIYLEATASALLSSPYPQGTFYSVAITPAIVNGNCSANIVVSQVSGSVTTLYTNTIPCHNGMTFHAAATQYGEITLYANTVGSNPVYIGAVPYTKSFTGLAGFGISGAPSGSTSDYIANLQIGPIDRTPPNPVSGANAYVQSNRVDIHAAGTTDDANGIGVGPYFLYRNGQLLAYNSTPDFTDTTVQRATAYSYVLYAMDWHYNLSSPYSLNVTTLPANAVEPRETGIRPTGTYWGGMGEQIDTLFGNLNYTFPLVSAQGRGWTVPLQLSYNSQNWVQDAGGTDWHFGNDSGFGYGWNLQIGVLRRFSLPGSGATDHYEFRDASGAVYRLNQNSNGIWSSLESVYVWYDSNANVLHFPN
ncbi:MAG: hypothetical protein JO061_24035, partial [Acidobacteriaceae bacterium]|nr:hypothetical protein [Acidobacteriaceae bacterium]